jgi:LysR family transcriptional regulator, transcriptional activator of nhaA
VLSYADEIFSIGDELLDAIHHQQTRKATPFRVGISDSVSKSVAYRMLEPSLNLKEPIRLICREGRLEFLLSELSVHRLDMIIADRPMPSHLNVKGFNHLLGESDITLFGAKSVITHLKGKFPECLNQAPLLLLGEDAAIRIKIEHWLTKNNLHPIIAGEFDDGALMKAFGQAGAGLFFASTTMTKYICTHYNVRAIGIIETVTEQFYAITTDRKLTHPAIAAISEKGRKEVFGEPD